MDASNDSLGLLKDKIHFYDRFIPHKVFELLGKEDISDIHLGDQKELKLTILFSDIRNFSHISESMKPKENFDFVNAYLSFLDAEIDQKNGIINKFIGDGIMAIFPTNADDALACSVGMNEQLALFNEQLIRDKLEPVRTGIGLNTGLCMLGIVGGNNRMEATVIGDIVNVASRIESLTKRYGVQILITEQTRNNVNAERYCIRLIDRVKIRGKNQSISIYEVYDNDCKETRLLKQQTESLFEEALANYHYKKMDVATTLFEKCFQLNPNDRPVRSYLERCKEYARTNYHEGAGELYLEQMEWTGEFEVGNKLIDKQHLELFNQSMHLQNALKREIRLSEIEEIIGFLDYFIKEHFYTEENFLREHEYSFLDHQQGQHRNFMRLFESLKQEIISGTKSKTYLMFRTQILLIDWLVNHIFREDRHYGKYI
jgi:hemerythrin-like metal-binding protein